MNAQVIALVNQKGGVGKTTSCVNLGIGLAQAGKKVLAIDCDPQSSLSISLGHSKPDTLPVTLSDMVGKVLNDQPIAPGEGILHHAEGVDLMPSDIQLSGMEVSLVKADLRSVAPHGFTLFSAARDIYTDTSGTMVSDLANAEVVDTLAFSLIVNALLVARYGCAVLKITDREGKA